MTAKTALILLDLQNGIVPRFVKDNSYLLLVSAAIAASRTADIPIIYIKTSFRPHYPEISSRNLMFSGIPSSGNFIEGSSSVEISSEIAPCDGDIVVTKRRVSAFSGSDLDCILRGLEITELVLAGIATSGAVLSTVREAADLDYGVVVLGDCCLDGDEEVHRVLVEKVFPRQARVLESKEWIEEIGGRKE